MPRKIDRVHAASVSSIVAPSVHVGCFGVCFRVSDGDLVGDLRAGIDAAIWLVVDDPRDSAVLVTDDLVRDIDVVRAGVIEVVAPTPRAAYGAVARVMSGVSQGVVLSDEPGSLGAALAAWSTQGVVMLTGRTVALKHRFPALTTRQNTLLTLISRGESAKVIARELGVSLPTVNREIDKVERLLAVTSRTALAATAVSLGFLPPAGGAGASTRRRGN